MDNFIQILYQFQIDTLKIEFNIAHFSDREKTCQNFFVGGGYNQLLDYAWKYFSNVQHLFLGCMWVFDAKDSQSANEISKMMGVAFFSSGRVVREKVLTMAYCWSYFTDHFGKKKNNSK